jgi:hypothetical protein
MLEVRSMKFLKKETQTKELFLGVFARDEVSKGVNIGLLFTIIKIEIESSLTFCFASFEFFFDALPWENTKFVI